MVADIFGVGRADANINQRNSLTVFSEQMPGRHLVLFPRQIGNRFLRRFGIGGDPDSARAGKRYIWAVRIEDLTATPAHEFINVAGVVGEQHERLEVLDRCAGVVTQARQREVDAAGIKMRQRIELSGMG